MAAAHGPLLFTQALAHVRGVGRPPPVALRLVMIIGCGTGPPLQVRWPSRSLWLAG